MSNLGRTTRVWNDLHQVRSKSKSWKASRDICRNGVKIDSVKDITTVQRDPDRQWISINQYMMATIKLPK